MIKYLVNASKQGGLFNTYEHKRYYLMSREHLSGMLSDPVSWAIWSAEWVNIDLTPVSKLKEIYGEIEIMD